MQRARVILESSFGASYLMEDAMNRNHATGELTASAAETAIYTMLLSHALLEILEEKGLVTRREVTARMKKLKTEARGIAWVAN